MSGRRGRRAETMLLAGTAILLAVGSAFLADALFSRRKPAGYAIEDYRIARPDGNSPGAPGAKIERLAKTPMSKTAAKASPSAPPRATLPDLGTLVRLVGITEFRKGAAKEAIIENLRLREAKSYQVGQKVENIGAEVRKITDTVILRYDEKLWILSFEGIREAPADALGSRPERPGSP
jgi:hypothetical protein